MPDSPNSAPIENTPAAPVAPTLADQYELADSSYDPDLDAPSSSAGTPRADSTPPPAAPPAPEPKEKARPVHSTRVLRMARDLNVPQHLIDTLSAEELDELVYDQNQRAMAWAFGQAQARNAPAPQEKPAPEEDDSFGLSEEEGYDPKIINAVKKAAGSRKELDELKKELAELKKRDQERETSSANHKVDSAFAALPPAYKKVFGDKALSEMTEDDRAEHRRRVVVLQMAGVDLRTTSGAALTKKLKEAADSLFGPLLSAAAEPEPEPEAAPARETPLEQRKRQYLEGGLARPTHRESKEPKGTGRATKAVAQLMRENGLGMDGYGGDEENGLPG